MKEIEIKNEIRVFYEEINDGEAICIFEENSGEVTDEIILLRPVALELAKIIIELMENDEEAEK